MQGSGSELRRVKIEEGNSVGGQARVLNEKVRAAARLGFKARVARLAPEHGTAVDGPGLAARPCRVVREALIGLFA